MMKNIYNFETKIHYMELTWLSFLLWFMINFFSELIIFIPIRIFLQRKISLPEKNLKITIDIITTFTEILILLLILGFPPVGYLIGIAVLMGLTILFADWLGGKVEAKFFPKNRN
jgi:hypothetical protein